MNKKTIDFNTWNRKENVQLFGTFEEPRFEIKTEMQ